MTRNRSEGPDPARVLAWTFGVAALALSLAAPFKHGPDANYYFGTALRVARGAFGESVEGLYSPLLSWLMAAVHLTGPDLTTSFRLVSSAAITVVLLSCARIGRALGLTAPARVLACWLTGLHLIYWVVGPPTSDLLCAACYTGLAALLVGPSGSDRARGVALGVAGALGYLAKAIQLPIVLLFWGLTVMRRAVRPRRTVTLRLTAWAVATTALLSLPWIVVVSRHYGHPIISAQELLNVLTPKVAGAPTRQIVVGFDFAALEIQGKSYIVPKEASVAEASARGARLAQYARWIDGAARKNYFGDTAWTWWLAVTALSLIAVVARVRTLEPHSYVLFLAVAHLVGYLGTWGPHVRYYLPAIPLLHLLHAWGLDRARSWLATAPGSALFRRFGPTLLVAVVLLTTVEATIQMGMSDYLSLREMDQSLAEELVAHPALREGTGAVTGRVHDEYAGYVAYRLGREFWGAVDPSDPLPPDALARNLARGRVDQIIWEGEPYEPLESTPGVVRRAEVERGGRRFVLYDFEPQ